MLIIVKKMSKDKIKTRDSAHLFAVPANMLARTAKNIQVNLILFPCLSVYLS